MSQFPQPASFGKRNSPHMVIIARGDDIRHFTVRPWVLALAGSAIAAIAVGYLMATTYLVLRDDLIGATVARQARMQQAYEDRISALRTQVDRITSRQLLDQQLMETKVTELIERQSQLYLRHGRLTPIVERAATDGVAEPVQGDKRAEMPAIISDEKAARLAAALGPTTANSAPAMAFWETRKSAAASASVADEADRLFVAINQSLRAIETEQLDRITTIASDADTRADQIAEALEGVGFEVEMPQAETGLGGPLIAVDDAAMFETRVRELDEALERLETAKRAAKDLPIHSPAKGYSISSSFGIRRDPLIGRPAMHSGMDFRAPQGVPARAAGTGTVVKAGWNGGYGRMVEVDHGDGLTTRYAHLSKIGVKVGTEVATGDVLGKVGSTGRSTGPHLHYEIRRNGTAVDPLRFIKAGRKIANLL